jgi:hypothetical protein
MISSDIVARPVRHEQCLNLSPELEDTSGALFNDGTTLLYRGSSRDFGDCQFKARCCCSNAPPRSPYKGARDVARSLAGTTWEGSLLFDLKGLE